jgi:hypothetical protein
MKSLHSGGAFSLVEGGRTVMPWQRFGRQSHAQMISSSMAVVVRCPLIVHQIEKITQKGGFLFRRTVDKYQISKTKIVYNTSKIFIKTP